ncbi:MAG: DUF4397 domain-containing protein [Ilumatobacter sp.]|nr:DUF4397 domain-containing protein [Ilumatobacter sp.]
MGHQFARAAAAAALAAGGVACGGGGGEAEPPPVLDNARDLVAAADSSDVAASAPAGEVGATVAGELPPPDPSRYEGANRVVNLLIGPDGEPVEIDVWGRRTFENGPILLASGLGFGDASSYVAAPVEYTVVAVGAGAGPDGLALAEIFNAVAGERITSVVATGGDGEASVTHVFEVGSETGFEAPAPGTGLLIVAAPNVEAFGDDLTAEVGSDRFEIGDGSEACRPQRRERAGLEPEILGDPGPVELQVPAGVTTLSIHPWVPTAAPCSLPAVLEIDVEVAPDSVTLVLVARTPSDTIEAFTLPVAPS